MNYRNSDGELASGFTLYLNQLHDAKPEEAMPLIHYSIYYLEMNTRLN